MSGAGPSETRISALRRAVERAPSSASDHYELALALKEARRIPEAAAAFQRAIELAPGSPDTCRQLADVLKGSGQRREAISLMQHCVLISPSADTYSKLASLLGEDRQFAESERFLRAALELDPDHVESLGGLGFRLQQLGRFAEAAAIFKKMIELDPECSEPYQWLVRDRKVTEADRPLINRMEEMVGQTGKTVEDIRNLSYALGKSYEDLGDYGKAMGQYDEANKLSAQIRFRGRPFPREEQKAATDRTIRAFTSGFLTGNHGISNQSLHPIFIVGMMRSGTTLTEQILSSHEEIAPGGEIPFWFRPDISKALTGLYAHKIDMADLQTVASLYETRLGADAGWITDKTPQNYAVLGVIRLMFPNAKVIHCRRNPVDTCLSMYTTPFLGANYLFNKGNIVFAYKEYQRLMNHWRTVLPGDFLFEVDYETLIANREPLIRDMLAFIGLPWDEACMQHDKNTREVTTPSMWQARQPIYATSLERWRKFEPWLGEFGDLV